MGQHNDAVLVCAAERLFGTSESWIETEWF